MRDALFTSFILIILSVSGMNKIVWVIADGFSEYNSSHFRCTLLYNQLNKSDGWTCEIITVDDWLANNLACKKSCHNANAIIIQRVLIKESLATALIYKKLGVKVYVDFDDAYQLIGEENAAYPFWGEGKINVKSPFSYQAIDIRIDNPVRQFKLALGEIDGGITPSHTLSDDWSKYGKMHTIFNYLDWDRYQYAYENHNHIDRGDIIVGWGGSMSHLTSFSGSGVIEALQKMTRDKIGKFLLVGDKRVLPMLKIPASEILFNPYVMWMEWIKILLRFDIGLAPLSGEYDCRRSRLKVMEYIALGIPFIATKSVVYEDFFNCTSGIFIEQGKLDVCDISNTSAWIEAIESITKNFSSWKKEAILTRDEYKSVIAIETQNLDNKFSKLL